MKKSLLFFIFIVSSFIGSAQLEVKEGSFKEVTGFVNVNTEKLTDDNDQPYAVLKVRTENIDAKQRQELSFKGDARTFFAIEHKDGEVWVYLSYYATYIKISHPDLSSTEFRFPFEMEPKKGYELTLVNKKTVDEELETRIGNLENMLNMASNDKSFGYLIIKTYPVDGATVIIDGQEMDMQTPFVSEKMEVGPHRIQVVKENYQEYVTVVKIDKDEINKLNIRLYSNKQKELTNNSMKTSDTLERTIGLYLIPRFALNISDAKLQVDLDYLFNNGVSIGGGISYINNINYSSLSGMAIYMDLTWYITEKNTTPIVAAEVGYHIPLESRTVDSTYLGYTYTTYGYKYRGPYFTLSGGLNYKRSLFSLVLGYSQYYDMYFKNAYPKNMYIGFKYSYLIPFGKKEK